MTRLPEDHISSRSLFGVGFFLLLGAMLPLIPRPLDPSDANRNLQYWFDLGMLFPALIAIGLVILCRLNPGWLRTFGLVLLTSAIVVLGVMIGFENLTGGFVQLKDHWHILLVAGVALVYVGSLGISHNRSNALLILCCVTGGCALLAWALIPRPVTIYEVACGLHLIPNETNIPIHRAFERNFHMPEGTKPVWHLMWTFILLIYVLAAVLAVLLPCRKDKSSSASSIYGLLYSVLAAFLWIPIGNVLFELHHSAGEVGPVPWDRMFTYLMNASQVILVPISLIAVILMTITEVFLMTTTSTTTVMELEEYPESVIQEWPTTA